MSICSACINTKPVARCVTNLTIGTVPHNNTAVYVYITDVTRERIIRYAVNTTANGTVTIAITPQRFSEDRAYEVHTTLQSAANINEKLPMTIDGEVADCASLNFETVRDNNNDMAAYANQTLSV